MINLKLLIKQAILLPLIFFIPTTIAGCLVEGYSFIGQHGSEITITNNHLAKIFVNTGAILSGISCILLAIGISMVHKKFYFTSTLITLWGISMVSNGLVPMGSPMHGIYGLGAVLMIMPFVACYELKNEIKNQTFFRITIVSGIVIFIYLWSIFVRLDPLELRGLTQRIASAFIFGWISYLSYYMLRLK